MARSEGGIQVVLVDAEAPPVAVSAIRADGGRWLGAWLAVRWAGRVVGLREVSFAGRDAVDAVEVASTVRDVMTRATGRVQLTHADPTNADPTDAAVTLPRISVVVPTNLGRPVQLRQCLLTLQAADYPDVEVIVVDNRPAGLASADPWPELTQGLHRVRVVRQTTPGISAARNAGVAAATGEVVAFTDDDVRVDPAWLRALGMRFALAPDEDAVTGLILPAELRTDAQLWFERHYGGFGGRRCFEALTFRGGGPGHGISARARVRATDSLGREVREFDVYGAGAVGAGANMAFRASALARLGAFDEALGTGTRSRGGEDLAMFITLLWEGGAIGYEPGALVFHTHREDYDDLRRQLHSYGWGFAAMLTSIVLRDPRHLAGVACHGVAVLRALRVRRRCAAIVADHPRPLGPLVPRELRWLERGGLLRGPWAYLRSWLTGRWLTRSRTLARSTGAAVAPAVGSVAPPRR